MYVLRVPDDGCARSIYHYLCFGVMPMQLSKPLKGKRLSTDVRDKALKKSRGELERSEREVERLRSSNRELEAKSMRMKDRIDELEASKQSVIDSKHGLLRKLLSESKKEHIYWKDGDPLFVIGNEATTTTSAGIKAMDMNLAVTEYAADTVFESVSTRDEGKQSDREQQQSDSSAFERYLEKIIRSARIFQSMFVRTQTKQTEIAEKHRLSTQRHSSDTEKVKQIQTALDKHKQIAVRYGLLHFDRVCLHRMSLRIYCVHYSSFGILREERGCEPTTNSQCRHCHHDFRLNTVFRDSPAFWKKQKMSTCSKSLATSSVTKTLGASSELHA